MNIYKKFILPRLLHFVMSGKNIEKLRPGVIALATGKVLEIGIGSGLNLPFYKNISKLYALELSQELVQMTREKATAVSFPVEFLASDAEHIPLPDQSVDTVVSTWTLCSIEKPEKALEEIARVLQPSGRFVFIDHGLSPRIFIQRLQNLFTPFTKYLAGNCHLNRDIKSLIQKAGFTINQIEEFHEHSKPLMYNSKGTAALRQRKIDKIA